MIYTGPSRRAAAVCSILLLASAAAASAHAPLSANAPQPSACAAPEYHQFDFWLGDWDAYDVGAAPTRSSLAIAWIAFSTAASCARITKA
jgi:disulfide bond formation protein DsbB